jgi:prevent-host-death family protein
MRSVNVAELKNRLSKYLTFARSGEEVVIRDRNLPVAKLVPFRPKAPTIKSSCWWRPENYGYQACDLMWRNF